MNSSLADVYYRVATVQEAAPGDKEKVRALTTKQHDAIIRLAHFYNDKFRPVLMNLCEAISADESLIKFPCAIGSELESLFQKYLSVSIQYVVLETVLELVALGPYEVAKDVSARKCILESLEAVRAVYPNIDLVKQADTILEILSKRSDYVPDEAKGGVVKQKRYNLRERKGVKYVR